MNRRGFLSSLLAAACASVVRFYPAPKAIEAKDWMPTRMVAVETDWGIFYRAADCSFGEYGALLAENKSRDDFFHEMLHWEFRHPQQAAARVLVRKGDLHPWAQEAGYATVDEFLEVCRKKP